MAYKDKTPEQQQNFKILHDGLVGMYGDKRRDYHFNMNDFQYDGNHAETEFEYPDFSKAFTEHDCNTAACALGHGPIFGIKGDECGSWSSCALEAFGVLVHSAEWRFLFSEHWSNDIQEAIARLKMYIEGFDPESSGWNYGSRYSV